MNGWTELLERWRGGDAAALEQLLAEVHPWLHREVGKAMGSAPRGVHDSMDIAQTAVVDFLRWGPRVTPESEAQFKALIRKIAKNQIIDVHRRESRRSAGGHVESLQGKTGATSLFRPSTSSTPPEEVEAMEQRGWVVLALNCLEDPVERRLVIGREIEGRTWNALSEDLGIESADAARMRWKRLQPRLALMVIQLQAGKVPTV